MSGGRDRTGPGAGGSGGSDSGPVATAAAAGPGGALCAATGGAGRRAAFRTVGHGPAGRPAQTARAAPACDEPCGIAGCGTCQRAGRGSLGCVAQAAIPS